MQLLTLCSSKTFSSTWKEILEPLYGHFLFSLYKWSWQPLIWFLVSTNHLFWMFHRYGMIQHVTFYVWLVSLGITFWRFLHLVKYITASLFLVLNDIRLVGYTLFALSVHKLMVILVVSTFWLLWVVLLWMFAARYLF